MLCLFMSSAIVLVNSLNADGHCQVLIAAELLKNADELVKAKIHPTSVISGYRLACKYDLLVVFYSHMLADMS